MVEMVHVKTKIKGIKSVTELPKSEWFGIHHFRVEVFTEKGTISKIMKETEYCLMVATKELIELKVLQNGQIIE